MSYARTALAAVVATLAVLAVAAPTADASRAVSLDDARIAPDSLTYLKAGESAKPAQCVTEVSAYGWRGRAIGAQTRTHAGFSWRSATGRVTFDGRTFRNRSRRAVLVAGWCS